MSYGPLAGPPSPRPVIGVTTRVRTVVASFGAQQTYTLSCHYTAAVREAGGIPLLLVPVDGDGAEQLVDRLDALMLTGGGDVGLDLYGGQPHPAVYDVDPERDALELTLVRLARERAIPVVGICRGMQLLNVALGGDLVVDVGSHLADPVRHRAKISGDVATHRVRLAPESRAAGIFGGAELEVNSYHHQALGRVAPGLRAVGWADDGIVEVIEGADESWPVLGVQWHPEYPSPDGAARCRPFEVLVEAAHQRAQRAQKYGTKEEVRPVCSGT